jgi:superfamily II DNA or RNA helicase
MNPLWLLINANLYHFDASGIDGKKITPFLKKKFIQVPQNVEEKYYSTFVASMIANANVRSYGFTIRSYREEPKPKIFIKEAQSEQAAIFGENKKGEILDNIFALELKFDYFHTFASMSTQTANEVLFENLGGNFLFTKVKRNLEKEREIYEVLLAHKFAFLNGKMSCKKRDFAQLVADNRAIIDQYQIEFVQEDSSIQYFFGTSEIKFEIEQKNDWFDIHSYICFGEFQIPFLYLREHILAGKSEIALPNGQTAIIPQEWFEKYGDFVALMEVEGEKVKLPSYYLGLVQDLQSNNLEQFTLSQKLEGLRDFELMEDYALPTNFKAELRHYQKSGFNWLKFLQNYHFGGILADDMGLGKTVQTLALLSDLKAKNPNTQVTSLLIVPTSLVFNWQREVEKFAPNLRVFLHVSGERRRTIAHFPNYDLIITTYGVFRLDVDILCSFHYHYAIIDEAQAIKNPNSQINRALDSIKSRFRLAITGTPVENSAMDLWSQMNFVNQGLLGNQNYFKNEFQIPIEKRGDLNKQRKLAALIKPFILRRTKKQVASELPPKVEFVQYCEMTDEQAVLYEKTKIQYRNTILEEIEANGIAKSQFLLLKGLTILRQLANHPKMVEQNYKDSSGKFDEMLEKLEIVLANKNKVLIFSQFVKHLAIVKEELARRNIRYNYIDGSVKNRSEQVDSFQNDAEIQVFLISLKAGGVGLNLTAADYVFVLDPWWNPAVEAQAIDRAHRIGQTKNVFVYKFIAKDTVEEKILRIQENKKQLSDDLISTDASVMKSLTREDIADIFR